MGKLGQWIALLVWLIPALATADGSYQALPLTQNWTNTALITVNDDWSGVPGITGYLGNSDPGAPTGVDPRTLTFDALVALDVQANQPNESSPQGGVGEFEITNPTIGLQGSGTADAPYIRLQVKTTGAALVRLKYDLVDIDGTTDNAVQQGNAQYRIGTSGVWTNISGTYVADASLGPSLSGQVTPIDVLLPSDAGDKPQVEVRIMTTNAVGADEWIGIDNIVVAEEVGVTVPALSRWGLGLLALAMVVSVAWMNSRRRRASA